MRLIILIFLIIVYSLPVNSQDSKKIEIINADKTYANTNLHPDYLRLVGSIIFKHNNSIMKCDSAHHFINNDIIKAFGNIKINQVTASNYMVKN